MEESSEDAVFLGAKSVKSSSMLFKFGSESVLEASKASKGPLLTSG